MPLRRFIFSLTDMLPPGWIARGISADISATLSDNKIGTPFE